MALAIAAIPTRVVAQIAFEPPGCEFRAVFVAEPTIEETETDDPTLGLIKSYSATLHVMLDGSPNVFRAECMLVDLPEPVDERLLLEDMQDLARLGQWTNVSTTVGRNTTTGSLVGQMRGEVEVDSQTTYRAVMNRLLGQRSMMDVYIASPPDTFPSTGIVVFQSELTFNGIPVFRLN